MSFKSWQSLFPGLLVGLGQLSPTWTFVFVPLGLSWFLYQSDKATRASFAWFFAFGYFLVSLYWVPVSMVIDVARYWWLMPIAFFGFPAFLALFFWAVTKILPWYKTRGVTKIFAASGAWLLFELLRGYTLTGFPWPLLGYAFSFYIPLNQIAFLTTIFGLSLIAFWVAAVPYAFLRSSIVRASGYALGVTVLLCASVLWGFHHIKTTPPKPLPPLTLVQGNIPQAVKWIPAHLYQNFETLMALSRQNAPGGLVIWPETALTYTMSETLGKRLAQIIPKGGHLITGGVRYQGQEGGGYRVYNSLYVINDAGAVVATYDKAHLLPFGEYIPFKAFWDHYFPWLMDLLGRSGAGFEAGEGIRTLAVPGIPAFSPMICYEIIFPGRVVNKEGVAPAWILNITNDAWFHNTAGPYQHLESARFRAIEENLPLVRVANNGISAIIDQFGRVIQTLPYNTRGSLSVG